MSARAVLNAAYTVLAKKADASDDERRMFGAADEDSDDPRGARQKLDDALGLSDDPIDGTVEETNVVELAAWVTRVNATMR
jgi:hypothetical protein